jgi:hypothetical protein
MALQSATNCVCGSTHIPGQGQGEGWPLNLPNPARIGLYFRNFWGIVEDSAYVLVYNDPSISRDESWIGLELWNRHPEGPGSSTDWAKRIHAWNMCKGKIATLNQEVINAPANWMYMYRNRGTCFQRTDALIFSKPVIFGIWTDKYAINLLENRWWDRFGGKRVNFRWWAD